MTANIQFLELYTSFRRTSNDYLNLHLFVGNNNTTFGRVTICTHIKNNKLYFLLCLILFNIFTKIIFIKPVPHHGDNCSHDSRCRVTIINYNHVNRAITITVWTRFLKKKKKMIIHKYCNKYVTMIVLAYRWNIKRYLT